MHASAGPSDSLAHWVVADGVYFEEVADAASGTGQGVVAGSGAAAAAGGAAGGPELKTEL